MTNATVTIVGGGLVGLATAYKLLSSERPPRVRVLEKEARVGAHQSGHNSGVLHCGLHYRPGSLKARMAVSGIREMIEFCAHHGVRHERCGKLVLAVDPAEVPRLDELERRGRANGLQGLKRLVPEEVADREPAVRGVSGLLVPEEGIVDFPGVCVALASEIVRLGGEVSTARPVLGVTREGPQWIVETPDGAVRSDFLVGCAGLQADRVARMAGARPGVAIVPFRGEYYELCAERRSLVRHMIYPVPDPAFPFLGVHMHRRIHGGVEGGPTAVLAFAREGYRLTDVDPLDLVDAVFTPGLWRFALRHPTMCAVELGRSVSSRAFTQAIRRLVPGIDDGDLSRSRSGVRAQALTSDGRLVEDFAFAEGERDLHVLNAPSPAATASLALGGLLTDKIRVRLEAL